MREALLSGDGLSSYREDKDSGDASSESTVAAQVGPNHKQLTLRAIIVGLGVGSLLCCSNTYFGLQSGWWVSQKAPPFHTIWQFHRFLPAPRMESHYAECCLWRSLIGPDNAANNSPPGSKQHDKDMARKACLYSTGSLWGHCNRPFLDLAYSGCWKRALEPRALPWRRMSLSRQLLLQQQQCP